MMLLLMSNGGTETAAAADVDVDVGINLFCPGDSPAGDEEGERDRDRKTEFGSLVYMRVLDGFLFGPFEIPIRHSLVIITITITLIVIEEDIQNNVQYILPGYIYR